MTGSRFGTKQWENADENVFKLNISIKVLTAFDPDLVSSHESFLYSAGESF